MAKCCNKVGKTSFRNKNEYGETITCTNYFQQPSGSLEALLKFILSKHGVTPTVASPEQWLALQDTIVKTWLLPYDRAVIGGYYSDRIAYAFLSGYQAAIRRLFATLPQGMISLCITEETGAHPRSIHAALDPTADGNYLLSGKKEWITLATESKLYLVAASMGTGRDGKNQIRMINVPASAPGITVTRMDVPIVPEISHGKIAFDKVPVTPSDLIPGDGYAQYIKPFRTAEDIHVTAAILAHVLRVAKDSGWPALVHERLLGFLASLRATAIEDPSSPAIHLVLSGLLSLIREELDSIRPLWKSVDAGTRHRWERDATILAVAEKARVARTEAARKIMADREISRDRSS